ncbi:PREDICTED: uncharacterized protein LOC107193219 [Dufourea novaeangliae]|uniref:uncharacterized protein LOC107193219 n=1 Tax=Dufourea novaeangliae TaxID=178035 RepID=UPI000767234E|nr:PREDICTED: uncharacterized protein LOC107193219 [Dufourea novaeangliae]
MNICSEQDNPSLEYTAIETKLPDDRKFFFVAAYATSNCKKEFMQDLKCLFDQLKLNNINNYYIIAGDFNAKHVSWGNSLNNKRGTSLHLWHQESQVTFRTRLLSTEEPSFPSSNSYLDLCLADSRIKFHNLISGKVKCLDYDSDHKAMHMTIAIESHPLLAFDADNSTQRRNFNNVDWPKFKKFLQDNHEDYDIPDNRNLAKDEIDIQLGQLNEHILEAMDNTIPYHDFNKTSTTKFITPLIKKLRKEKSFLITQVNNISKNNSLSLAEEIQVRVLKKLLKNTRHKIKLAFQASVSNYWEQKITNISKHKSKDLFPKINSIFRHKTSSTIETLKIPQNSHTLLQEANVNINSLQKDNDNNYIINKTTDKLNVIGAHFQKVHLQNDHLGKPHLTNIINRKINDLKQEIETDKRNEHTICNFSDQNTSNNPNSSHIPENFFTSTIKLRLTFRKLNGKKSASFDEIPNIVLKNLPTRYIYYYAIIFNNCLNLGYFPSAWKTAKLITIKKKDKEGNNPTSYRPISLLPNISKVFETIINNAINSHCTEKNIIPETQFGFRFHHSTVHAITKFTSDICWARNAGDCVGACFIDLEKAFDTVWLDGLFFKLLKKDFPKHLIKMLWDMLHEKRFFVTEGNSKSTRDFVIANGLQQGTVNSPVLFNIYISDLLQMYGLNNTDEKNNKSAIAFADDLLIYIKNSKPSIIKTQLQDLFEKVQDYFQTWKLKINTHKCETILFRPYISTISNASNDVRKNSKNFSLHAVNNINEKIPRKDTVRYLGVYLDFKLNHNNHVNIQIQKASRAFIANKRLFYSRELHKSVKIICYKTLIRPILTYGCQIWFNICAGTMEKLRVFERKCIRACLSKYRSPESNYTKLISNYKLYEEAKLVRIDIFMLKLIRDHWTKVHNITSNTLIAHSLYPNPLYFNYTRHTGYTPPESFVYLDGEGYIQNSDNIPLIYHYNRRTFDKKILYDKNIQADDINLRFMYKLSAIDLSDKTRKNTDKYWWL